MTVDVEVPALLGRYRPTALIGRGGMATVYRGVDEVLGRDVAVKVFRAGAGTDFDRHAAETRMLAALQHHGVVHLIDAGIDDSSPHDVRPILVMEYVAGADLARTLAARRLNQREIGWIAYDMAEALEFVHARGVVHRDIKPSNIMLVDYGTATSRMRAKLTDFGIALDATAVHDGDAEVTSGTPAYLSPEHARGDPLSSASDVYSLGLVLLQCFTGRLPFPGDTPVGSAVARLHESPAVPDDLPGDWTQLLRSMTRVDPVERPPIDELTPVFRQAVFASYARHKAWDADDATTLTPAS